MVKIHNRFSLKPLNACSIGVCEKPIRRVKASKGAEGREKGERTLPQIIYLFCAY